MAGSGKSTVCKVLSEMGYEAYGIEELEGMFDMYHEGTKELFLDYDNTDPEKIKRAEWLCNTDKLQQLIDQQQENIAFYCGIGSNMDDIIPLFDEMLVLRVDANTLHARLSNREGTDDIGNTEASRQVVLGWKEWWEEEMQDAGAIFIDASLDPQTIAGTIISRYK